MRLHNGLPHRMVLASTIAILSSVACFEKSSVEPDSLPRSETDASAAVLRALVVSDPILPAQLTSALPSLLSAAHGEVAYVSLPAGSLPNAINVTIRNVSWGAPPTPPIEIIDGGFDPIAVDAAAGDQLELRFTGAYGPLIMFRVVVPERRPPSVVRTNPPKGTTDVPLNARITVVFTEPVAPATVTTATVQLLQGTAPVPGTARVVAGSLFTAEFVPDKELTGGTTYRLVVTQGIRDSDGDSLEAAVATDFTTVSPFVQVVAGSVHTCALRADGQQVCWGGNWAGQLGAASQARTFGACYFMCSNEPVPVAGGHAFTSLASGFFHSCALTAAGEAFCWGGDANSELGANDARYCNPSFSGSPTAPSKCSGVPLRVRGSVRFEALVAGYKHSCGIAVGGAAFCWGFGSDGALGTGDAGVVASPAAVSGGFIFKSLTSGAHHVCGLSGSGAAYCWGSNRLGQLGVRAAPHSCIYRLDEDESRAPYDTSIACAKVPTLVSGGLTFVSLSAGGQHTCGLTASGRVYCWGDYFLGRSDGATPELVNSNLAFVSLSTGSMGSHVCGVTSANAAYCWGTNYVGELGDGSTTYSNVPVPVTGGLAFSAVTVGPGHSCGITTEATLYCWGQNWAGQLGAGSSAPDGSLRPIRVSGQQ